MFSTAEELGEGLRTGALGAPRFGKTTWLEFVIAEALRRRHAQFAWVHDTKREDVQYAGTVRTDLHDLKARPLVAGDSRVVVFHQDGDRVPQLDDLAAGALKLARTERISTLVVADELYKGLKGRQTWVNGAQSAVAECLREGSSIRVSVAWTTQIPQSLPTEAIDLTETTALFNLSGRSLSYVMDNYRLDASMAPVIMGLGRGEFVLVSSIGEWDRTIYGPS